MKNILILLGLTLFLASCDHRNDLADAYGNFEVEDIIVSAESNGILLDLSAYEGEKIGANKIVGTIDTTIVVINIQQIDAQIAAVNSKIGNVKAQIETLEQQKSNLVVNVKRVNNLLDSGAATQQQKDDLDGQLKLIDKQINATKTQISSIQKEIDVLKVQRSLLKEQLEKCFVKSPIEGVVLEKYAKAGEMVGAGKPIMKIADLTSLDLRCYISGERLNEINLGDEVEVYIDNSDNEFNKLKGIITWISSQAEFTPKIIQTKEERVQLVYAVKVKVKNDGQLKIGMPGELRLKNDSE